MNLIRGELFPTICDKVLMYYDQLYCDPNSILDGDIVYCDTHHILKFKNILNTKSNLTIITHNSDHCLFDGDIEYKNGINVDELSCYSRWFGQNSYSKKVIPIPIGFENKKWEIVNGIKTKFLEEVSISKIQPSSLVYFNCNIHTNIEERKKCHDELSTIKYVNIDFPNLSYLEYLNKIKSHMFTLSPRGNGLDCHRTWEILMMGRIPILKREGSLEKLYKNFPVLFVDKWTDIDSIDLKNIFDGYNFNNQEYLYFNYWENLIKQKL